MGERRRWTGIAVLVVAVATAAGVWLVRWDGPNSRYLGDSYEYARIAYRMHGFAADDAGRTASVLSCRWAKRTEPLPAAVARDVCTDAGMRQRPRQYEAIFDDRVGFPAAVALLLPALGTQAFAVVTGLCAVASAALLGVLVLVLTRSRGTAVAASTLLLLLPSGAWFARVGTEAPATVGALAAVLGTTWLLGRDHRRWGVVTLLLGGAWLAAVRDSEALALFGLLAVACAGDAMISRSRRSAGVAAALAALTAGVQGVMTLRHSPSLEVTLQDLLTRHFADPEVADPYGRWRRVLRLTLRADEHQLPSHLLSWLVVVAGLVSLVVVLRRRALPLLALAASGVAAVVVHPVFTEQPRLLLPVWVAASAGLALLGCGVATEVLRRRRPRRRVRLADALHVWV